MRLLTCLSEGIGSALKGGAKLCQHQLVTELHRDLGEACYQQRGDGAWVVVAPEYCATAAAPPVAPPQPRARIVRDELGERMLHLRERARTAIVAPACGFGSLSVKIGSAARPGGVNIRTSFFTSVTESQRAGGRPVARAYARLRE